MQSENFDNKIRDSLSQRPPGNENPEWDKMQVLLDRHLPAEKKDRRRTLFILFLFLLLGGGAFLIWQNNGSNDDITASKPTKESSTPNNTADNSAKNNDTRSEPTVKEIPQNNAAGTSPSPNADRSLTQPQTNSTQKTNEIVLPGSEKAVAVTIPKTNVKINRDTKDAGVVKPDKQVTEQANKNTQPITSVEKNNDQRNVPAVVEKPKPDESQKITAAQKPGEEKEAATGKINEEQKQSKPAESQPTLTANSKTQKQKNKNSFLNNLFFTVSAGPDFSTVGFEDVGKIRPVIGAGIGYQFSEKFSLRTGFYTARKVYTADPYEYHPPYNVWTAYPNLKNIDANCKVYEIPLTIDYTISENKKQGWFVSAGISSFIMKEEIYDYHFKPNSSPTYVTYRKTITNQNKHYFSVLGLSGGYTRHINKNFSLRAEPYTKFGLGGVGYGKVKLNGGGVLVSAIIKPFSRK